MTYRDNITAILECNFAGFKEEVIANACNRILDLRPAPRFILKSDGTIEPIINCNDCEIKGELDQIKAEITAISISGQVDDHTMFVRSAEQVKQMALEIIDKYKAESEAMK